jgi:tetratricopeptide (TPR) repeat protein
MRRKRPISVEILISGFVATLGIGICGYEVRELFFAGNGPRANKPVGADQRFKQIEPLTIFTRPWSTPFVQARQRDKAKELFAAGAYQQALEAAVSFYNVCELSKTTEATKLIAAILSRTRGKRVAEEFDREQGLASDATASEPGVNGTPIFRTIDHDSTSYDWKITELEATPENFNSMIARGNLLLLSGRPKEARLYFEFALQFANAEHLELPDRTATAVEGIARTIRDEDGCAQRADAFIGSLQTAIWPSNAAKDSPVARIHAAATVIPPSGTFAEDFATIHFEYPEDPAVKATGDPNLKAWLSCWQAEGFSSEWVKAGRSELLELLTKSPLSSTELLSVGRSVSFHSIDDWAVSAFYAAGALRADNELKTLPIASQKARQLLAAMTLAKPTMWKVVDEGDQDFLDPLYTLNHDLSGYISSDDSRLRNAWVHGFVGASECLWLKGQYSEAEDTLSRLNSISLTEEQKRAAAWIRGLIFLSLGRYAEAEPQFQIVIKAPEFVYTENAFQWLIVCLARTGDAERANTMFDNWVRRFRPNVSTVARILELMDDNSIASQRS